MQDLTHTFGRTPLEMDRASIAEVSCLSEASLKALFSREVCAIHVRQYCDPALARRAAESIKKQAVLTTWEVPSWRGDIRTDMNFGIGSPKQLASDPETVAKYLADALPCIRKVRDAFAPQLSPMDRLRLELDELWSEGANVGQLEGQKGFVGLVRIMNPETLLGGICQIKGVCHVDASIRARVMSSNIYVDLPESGGELSIWNVALNDANERTPLMQFLASSFSYDPDAQEVIHKILPPPLVIRPSIGDLVILDSSRPHAVAGFSSGTRISIQSFIVHPRDNAGPLTLES